MDVNNGVCVYFRGRLSGAGDSQCVVAALINDKSKKSRRIESLSLLLDGESIIDYKAERDTSLAGEINGIYRSIFDGSFLGKYKPLLLKENQ